ncbi:hypothetical protein NDN08_002000 [Rhodosorus marinus]|uniref:RING-type E3 ubiquitin transferase n=1 Tax=Rhodosorus marinus TaxID=101924 RepID=A0AAV8USI7_9RHOD|nr:hypothetical protein NDN08_002000 [Rhodosorus marinus]
MGNTALSSSSSSTSSTLTRTVRQTSRNGGSDYSGPRSTERSSSNSVGRDNQHRGNPIQPWVDIQLPEPEKYRDFQSGPVPHVVSASMAPQAEAVYDLMDKDSEVELCPTCLEEYSDDNPKIIVACGHSFHLSCILEWANRSDMCPFFCKGKLKCPGIDLR